MIPAVISVEGVNIFVHSLYLPTRAKQDRDTFAYSNDLIRAAFNVPSSHGDAPVLIGGDFNLYPSRSEVLKCIKVSQAWTDVLPACLPFPICQTPPIGCMAKFPFTFPLTPAGPPPVVDLGWTFSLPINALCALCVSLQFEFLEASCLFTFSLTFPPYRPRGGFGSLLFLRKWVSPAWRKGTTPKTFLRADQSLWLATPSVTMALKPPGT